MTDIFINRNTDTKDSGAKAQQLLQQAWAANIDTQTTRQLTGLAQIRQARISQLQRQVVSLTAQMGATDSEVVSLQNSIKSQQSLASTLGAVSGQVSTIAPAAPANGWLVHGYVRDQNLQPVAKLTVFLANEQKEWLRIYGYAFTDATGYFNINYIPAGADDQKVSSATYLAVNNQKRQPLYIDSSALTINIGSTQYFDIVLSSQDPLGSAPSDAAASPPAAH